VCHQSVGLIARQLEEAGLPTLSMTSALSITRSVGVPRGAFVDFPLGHTTGEPHRPAEQMALLRAALQAFTELEEPGVVKPLPLRWSGGEDWRQEAFRSSGGGSDARTARTDAPQYQSEADRVVADELHARAGCHACVGID
jgi:hypothetical protein